MPEYQVLARKYRPQSFLEVLGQSPIVTTLKNAIKFNRLAHAYLFCGSRGTGKTTLARVFAKALNCHTPTADGEPCNTCSSCREIAAGNSLDVLEIDGASHRGIDDIRQINETVGYAAASGKYKIYIIDEVHMLTKEAFNALLKTLEEPPPKVMFLFATTEPHKVLPTILSRCQRFNLSRIPLENIIEKLRRIALELSIEVEDEALRLLAHRADGGLRDAESLFDQIIAFHEGNITAKTISDVLGIVPRETLFILDQAGKEGRLSVAFDIAYQIFSEGKDLIHFVETLTEHFRTLLLMKLSGPKSPLLLLSEPDQIRYEASAKLYTNEQCLTILDFLIEAQTQIRFQPSSRIALEAILLRIMRTHQRLPIEFLVRRLAELEQAMGNGNPEHPPSPSEKMSAAASSDMAAPKLISNLVTQQPIVKKTSDPSSPASPKNEVVTELSKSAKKAPKIQDIESIQLSVTEDPTPTREDLGLKPKKSVSASSSPLPVKDIVAIHSTPPSMSAADLFSSKPAEALKQQKQNDSSEASKISPPKHKQSHYDTLLQFATVELEGSLQKKQVNAFN
ncbi:MAG: DNA polymerase III subunit gamma/tau [Parachlamydiaceae bacterium]|nr:DNA polymerase III subunit gamma/tau [Parachlamydiaceae bacterium]